MMEIHEYVTGKTCLTGLVGNPVEHSISPQIHNTVSSLLGVDMIYVPFKVEENCLGSLINGLKAINVKGFNVTVPYKQKIMDYLDHISDEALVIGAVNTVKNINGKLYGYNTDGEGFARSIERESGTSLQGKSIALIGAGGAARAIGVKAAVKGARKITVINRTLEKAEELANVINEKIVCCSDAVELDLFKNTSMVKDYDIVVNTTTVGMYPNTEISPMGDSINFAEGQIVYDAIYNPERTMILLKAAEKGCMTVNGLGMLLYQGISAYEIWTGVKVPEEIVEKFYIALQKYMKNYIS